MQKVIISLVFSAAVLMLGCEAYKRSIAADRGATISGYGQVRYVNLEEGFFGIIGESGEKYEPINLPSDLRKNKLEIKFKARPRADITSSHMWGTPIEILDAKPTGK